MSRRQSPPDRWLIIADCVDGEARRALGKLPRGSGVMVLCSLKLEETRWLRHIARLRQLVLVFETDGEAVRVHSIVELRKALLRRTPLIFLSPLHPTRTHPDWAPIPRLRAATLARLGGRKLAALGGMNARRFDRLRSLGFRSWAGISAFRS